MSLAINSRGEYGGNLEIKVWDIARMAPRERDNLARDRSFTSACSAKCWDLLWNLFGWLGGRASSTRKEIIAASPFCQVLVKFRLGVQIACRPENLVEKVARVAL